MPDDLTTGTHDTGTEAPNAGYIMSQMLMPRTLGV